MGDTLFSIPFEPQGSAPSPGSITVTRPAARVYLVTFTSEPDNRLTTNFNNAYLLALDILEHRYQRGVVITTSGIAKFYSNGMDLEHVAATPKFLANSFYRVFRRMATYPMPTIALINGHAFAGGLLLAMHHDYRVQNPKKGFISMNELFLGVTLQPPMTSIFREKVSPAIFRQLILEGYRFPAKESLQAGLVDELGGLDEALAFVEKRKLITVADSAIYGQLKEDMYRNTIGLLLSDEENDKWREAIEMEKTVKSQEAIKRIEAWEKKNGKAKL